MQESKPTESRQSLKTWIPSIVLICLMFVLLSATRVYIGGPDGMEVVWKGEMSFADTFVNVSDYIGLPRKEFKNRFLLDQMEDMGLLDTDADEARLRNHRRKKLLKQKQKQAEEELIETESQKSTESGEKAGGEKNRNSISSEKELGSAEDSSENSSSIQNK